MTCLRVESCFKASSAAQLDEMATAVNIIFDRKNVRSTADNSALTAAVRSLCLLSDIRWILPFRIVKPCSKCPMMGGEMKWDQYIRCASNKLSYICNNSPIFGQSFTCTCIRDRGRPSKYNRKHNCCVIGVWWRVIGVRKTHHCHRHFEKMTVDDWCENAGRELAWDWVTVGPCVKEGCL